MKSKKKLSKQFFGVITIIIIIVGIISCDNAVRHEEKNTIVQTDTTSDKNENKPDEQSKNFEIKFSDAKFIYKKAKGVIFIANFEMLNKTNSKITKFYFDQKGDDGLFWDETIFINVTFENGETKQIPNTGNGNMWQYKNENIIRPNISKSNPWLPNTSKKFHLSQPSEYELGDNGMSNWKFPEDYFERNATNVILEFNYLAISVDGEYRETQKFDLMDQWKDYQKQLGLR